MRKDPSLDPAINNPLSQEQDSPWNQHFQDGEMRKMIKQDVVRTFPEVDFFQTQLVRETLVNILFVYARCHPEIGYRQVGFVLVELLRFMIFNFRECMSCWPLCTLW
jgi:TBC1 domain family protein 5